MRLQTRSAPRERQLKERELLQEPLTRGQDPGKRSFTPKVELCWDMPAPHGYVVRRFKYVRCSIMLSCY